MPPFQKNKGIKALNKRQLDAITQLTIRFWFDGIKSADHEQDHQASEKLSC